MIWATRGRTWGFRFLDRGGLDDPLHVYEEAFAGIEGEHEVCRRAGTMVAVRFLDPDGRRDSAGRLIPHDFVILGPPQLVESIDSVDAGRAVIWPVVADRFETAWLAPEPPPVGG
jgi:hypothetical protein